jgi:hypothetical protein
MGVRAHNYINRVGRVYGRWTVIDECESIVECDKKRSAFLCRCECGVEKIVTGKMLDNGYSKSCGCYRKEITSKRFKNILKNGNDDKSMVLYKKHKISSSNRNIESKLSYEEFKNLIKLYCDYCGNPPSNMFKYAKQGETRYFYYSGIDRIDSDKGYIITNCVYCNRAKGTMDRECFFELIKMIYNKNLK